VTILTVIHLTSDIERPDIPSSQIQPYKNRFKRTHPKVTKTINKDLKKLAEMNINGDERGLRLDIK
jgi:hypothetical protein